MNPRVYFSLVVTVACFVLGLLLLIANDVEEYSGSQTRTGGFLESEFAPRELQQVFKSAVYAYGYSSADYDKYFDIVVVGDSFSYSQRSSWLNFLAKQLNASAIFLHIDDVALEALLQNPTFRAQPPKHFLLQSGEGRVFVRFSRLRRLSGIDPLAPTPIRRQAMQTSHEGSSLIPYGKAEKPDLRTALGVAGHYLRNKLQRATIGNGGALTIEIDIDCPLCFSHKKNSSILIGSRGLDRASYKFHLQDEAVEGIETLSSVLESNCWTELRTLVFPNKLNVYRAYTDLEYAPTIFTAKLRREELKMVEILEPLRRSVREGVVDVYAPHDHHATANGYRVVARTLGEELSITSGTEGTNRSSCTPSPALSPEPH